MTETKPQYEFVVADRICDLPIVRPKPEILEIEDIAAADFTQRRCERFINADVAR